MWKCWNKKTDSEKNVFHPDTDVTIPGRFKFGDTHAFPALDRIRGPGYILSIRIA
jgi:hypothetical protein